MLNLLLEAAEICKNSSNLPTNSHFPLRKQNWMITKSGFKNSIEKSGWQVFASFSNPQNLFLGLNLILSIQMAPRNFRNWKEIESCEPLSIFLKLYDSVNRVICSFWQVHLHQQQEELRASWEFFFLILILTGIEKVKLFQVNQPHLKERKFTPHFPNRFSLIWKEHWQEASTLRALQTTLKVSVSGLWSRNNHQAIWYPSDRLALCRRPSLR